MLWVLGGFTCDALHKTVRFTSLSIHPKGRTCLSITGCTFRRGAPQYSEHKAKPYKILAQMQNRSRAAGGKGD